MNSRKRRLATLRRLRKKTFPTKLLLFAVIIIIFAGVLQCDFNRKPKLIPPNARKISIQKIKTNTLNTPSKTYENKISTTEKTVRLNEKTTPVQKAENTNKESKKILQQTQKNGKEETKKDTTINEEHKTVENDKNKTEAKPKTKQYTNNKGELTEDNFNDKGKIIKRTVKNADGKIIRITDYNYDSSDKNIENTQTKFDSDGNIIEKTEFKSDGQKLLLRQKINYTPKGKISQKEDYITANGKSLLEEKIKYNSSGKISVKEKRNYSGTTLTVKTISAYTSDGKEIGSSVLQYNSAGNVVSTKRSPVKLNCGITLTFLEDKNYKYQDTDDKGNNINRKIDEPVSQGATGDCWLLAAVNALSYTPYGQIIIKDAIKKNIDGSVSVTFKGVNKFYTISASDLEKAERCNLSNGDDDMMVIEIAAILYAKESKKSSSLSEEKIDSSFISGGVLSKIFKMFGLTSKREKNPDDNKIDEMLDYFSTSMYIISQPYYAMNFSWHPKDKEKPELKCVDGTTYTLITGHAYSIKNVTPSTVTFVNPWDSGKEFKISRDTFKSIQKTTPGNFYISFGSRD